MTSGSDEQGPRRRTVTGAVLAGGRSRRMGGDKRALEVGGVPLLRRAVGTLAAVCDEVLVVTRRQRPVDTRHLHGTDAREIHDLRRDAGPLAGIEAALTDACGEVVVVVATDLPWLSAAVLGLLVDALTDHPTAGAAALRADAWSPPEPLLAAYRRSVLPSVQALLDAGQRRSQALLDAVEVVDVGPERWGALDPAGRAATNLNTPDDLARLRATSSLRRAHP